MHSWPSVCIHNFICYNADKIQFVNCPGPAEEEDAVVTTADDNDDDDDKFEETVAGPKVLAHVDLAKTICE